MHEYKSSTDSQAIATRYGEEDIPALPAGQLATLSTFEGASQNEGIRRAMVNLVAMLLCLMSMRRAHIPYAWMDLEAETSLGRSR